LLDFSVTIIIKLGRSRCEYHSRTVECRYALNLIARTNPILSSLAMGLNLTGQRGMISYILARGFTQHCTSPEAHVPFMDSTGDFGPPWHSLVAA